MDSLLLFHLLNIWMNVPKKWLWTVPQYIAKRLLVATILSFESNTNNTQKNFLSLFCPLIRFYSYSFLLLPYLSCVFFLNFIISGNHRTHRNKNKIAFLFHRMHSIRIGRWTELGSCQLYHIKLSTNGMCFGGVFVFFLLFYLISRSTAMEMGRECKNNHD